MREFEPELYDIIYWIIPEHTNELFMDVRCLENYRTAENRFHRDFYKEIKSRISEFGENIFIYDAKSCDFLE